MGRIIDSIDSTLKEELNRRGIDERDILEDYAKGMGTAHIRIKYKISDELLKIIIKEYGNKNIERKRKEQHEKWNIPEYKKIMNNVDKQVPKVSLADAIKKVEGEER